jgi:hypothetical protein
MVHITETRHSCTVLAAVYCSTLTADCQQFRFCKRQGSINDSDPGGASALSFQWSITIGSECRYNSACDGRKSLRAAGPELAVICGLVIHGDGQQQACFCQPTRRLGERERRAQLPQGELCPRAPSCAVDAVKPARVAELLRIC